MLAKGSKGDARSRTQCKERLATTVDTEEEGNRNSTQDMTACSAVCLIHDVNMLITLESDSDYDEDGQ